MFPVEALQHAMGAEVVSQRPLRGGDNAAVLLAELDDGRRVVLKTDRRGAPSIDLCTEAAGLEWLRAAGAVAVPEVFAVVAATSTSPPFLVMEWIQEGAPTAATEPELGVALAGLHRSGAPCFGREDRRTTGSRHLPNEPCDSWAEFYRSQRLLPLARLARDAGALTARDVGDLESVAGRLELLGGDEEPPARLHGDLWAGNRLIDGHGRSWLIDPAAHGGHREFDLAMMRLFGGFGDECFAAYDEVAPLAPGWRDRIELHQLAPLVVHAIKFGGGYAAATGRALARYR